MERARLSLNMVGGEESIFQISCLHAISSSWPPIPSAPRPQPALSANSWLLYSLSHPTNSLPNRSVLKKISSDSIFRPPRFVTSTSSFSQSPPNKLYLQNNLHRLITEKHDHVTSLLNGSIEARSKSSVLRTKLEKLEQDVDGDEPVSSLAFVCCLRCMSADPVSQ